MSPARRRHQVLGSSTAIPSRDGYFEETKIPAVPPGKQVEIYLMSGGPALHGHVESISRGITNNDNPSGPELLDNPTPTFEWVRLAQRIPVRIHIDTVPAGIVTSVRYHIDLK